jgi:hypothetical protein
VAGRVDAALSDGLGPLLRDLRQTIASFRARDKTPIEVVLLTGGTAAQSGLGDRLSHELGLPVVPFAPAIAAHGLETGDDTPVAARAVAWGADGPPPAQAAGPEGGGLEELPAKASAHFAGRGPIMLGLEGLTRVPLAETRFTLAAAIACAGARGQKEIDLRRGPLQYRASFSMLRQKAAHLILLAVLVIVSASVDVTMALGRLTREQGQLEARLKTASTELFGRSVSDAQFITRRLKKGFTEDMAPVPKTSALDLLSEISRRMPSAERIKLDVTELDIRPKKTVIKGTVDSAAAVDEIVAELKKIECFEEITKGPITEVAEGAKQFTLHIASTCP